MKNSILQVFYGVDCLPYKDKERVVHFPIVGNTFQNSSNTTEIHFYFKDLGDEETTWVAVSKLPNGKIGSKILDNAFDEELNEKYAILLLDDFYTQAKGDVFISLQGYQGGVEIIYDEETNIYSIKGTPTIRATGSIKLGINYATPFISSGVTESATLQRVLAELGTKLGIRSKSVFVETLPEIGESDTFYVIKNDISDPNKANIYIWNQSSQSYIWVGDNTLDLGDYYTKSDGADFERELQDDFNEYKNDLNGDFNDFKETVNTRVSSVESELSSVAQGSPQGVYSTLVDLQTAYPTGTTGIYLVAANGHWYYWNGSAWTDGGVYLSNNSGLTNGGYNTISDANSAAVNSFYWINSKTDNFPNGASGTCMLCSIGYTSSYTAQYLIGTSTGGFSGVKTMWFRICINDSWSPWQRLADNSLAIINKSITSGYGSPADANDAENNSFYYVYNVTTNYPTTNSRGVLITCGALDSDFSSYKGQLFVNIQTGTLYSRGKYGNVWSPWRECIYNTTDTLYTKIKNESSDGGYGPVNANDAENGTFYWINNRTTNYPESSSRGILISIGLVGSDYSSYKCQLFIKSSNGVLYSRGCVGGNWTQWNKNDGNNVVSTITNADGTYYGPADANDCEINKVYWIKDRTTNYPYTNARGTLMCFGATGYTVYATQIFVRADTGETYTRGIYGGTWSKWINLTESDKAHMQIAGFTSIGGCGDSWTAGYMADKNNVIRSRNLRFSWVKTLSRRNGIENGIYAKSGVTFGTWLTDGDCLSALQNDTAKDLYVIALGINDSDSTFGTPDDIDLDNLLNSGNTSCGNMARIVYYILQKNSEAKIVFCTIPYSSSKNALIKSSAEKLGVACAETEYLPQTSSYFANGHPTRMGQTTLADIIEKAVEKAMDSYGSYFNLFTYDD